MNEGKQDVIEDKWTELLHQAGVLENGRLSGVVVHETGGADADDVVMCPADDVDRRMMSLRDARPRARQVERMFLARALRHDASTAAALLVRAVIGRWVHARGKREITDPHERRAWALIENHVAAAGLPTDGDVTAGRMQIAEAHVRAPLSNAGPADVVRKAMEQFIRQIDGRHVIVMGRSPQSI